MKVVDGMNRLMIAVMVFSYQWWVGRKKQNKQVEKQKIGSLNVLAHFFVI